MTITTPDNLTYKHLPATLRHLLDYDITEMTQEIKQGTFLPLVEKEEAFDKWYTLRFTAGHIAYLALAIKDAAPPVTKTTPPTNVKYPLFIDSQDDASLAIDILTLVGETIKRGEQIRFFTVSVTPTERERFTILISITLATFEEPTERRDRKIVMWFSDAVQIDAIANALWTVFWMRETARQDYNDSVLHRTVRIMGNAGENEVFTKNGWLDSFKGSLAKGAEISVGVRGFHVNYKNTTEMWSVPKRSRSEGQDTSLQWERYTT